MSGVRASVVVGRKATATRELPWPAVPSDAGLLRIEAAGVCGSDVGSYEHDATERVMGHENVGVVEELGPQAAERWGVRPGDRVALEEYLPCGHCRYCRTTEFRLCLATDPRLPGAVRYGSTGVEVVPALWGGFSQYLYLHPRSVLHKVPPGVPAELLALALPLGNGYEWSCVLGGAGPGKAVVVYGPGQQGLACVFAAKQAGADLVVALGLARDSRRLEVARALGADATVNVEEQDPLEVVRELTGGELADVVIDTAAGSGLTVGPALRMLRRTGTLVLPTDAGEISVPLDLVRKKFLTIRGARGHSYQAVEWAVGVIASGRYPLGQLCTHRFGLEGVDRAIRATGGELGPEAIHVTVDPWLGA